jgi:glycogen debranching enzyme
MFGIDTRAGEPAPNPFYIQTPSGLADEQSRVLKYGDTFAVFDHLGDIKPTGLGEEGLFHNGTRHLSCLLLLLDQHRPLFLSSTVKEDNVLLTVDLTNPDLVRGDQIAIHRGTVHIFRSKFLWRAACYERLRFNNFGMADVEVNFSLHFRADFVDIFEVRGSHRNRRGRYLPALIDGSEAMLTYEGLDGVRRRTRLAFSPPPVGIQPTDASFRVVIPPHGESEFEVVATCETGHERSPADPSRYETARAQAEGESAAIRRHTANIGTSDARFTRWVNRAVADLAMMITHARTGRYPYAGVPWFSTPFGRDGLITAYECLWVDPGLARGVLAFLADTQAREVNPAQDAEPGKILHEARSGEMAALGEVPFGRYYGSVDATPLFVWLTGEYFRRTGDREFVSAIWPNVLRALDWIDTYGDQDRDGFIEYQRTSPNGLVQQGWKDSHDSVFHADGAIAQGPIALCEVQGYVYAGRLASADLAEALGDSLRASELRCQAAALKERFEQAFWCQKMGTYAIALDGEKRPCRVRTSNPGHCLLTGIADPERGRHCGRDLLSDAFFTGWGIRTLAAGEPRFNPMSYHNGSVWPHDNAMAAAGLARYGLRSEALRVLNAFFDVSATVDLHRLPELFCGFRRRSGEGPTRYPVACSPQAWSAAAVFLLLQACLGLSVRADPPEVSFMSPMLPEYCGNIHINNLRVGAGSVDVRLNSSKGHVQVDVIRREGNAEVRFEP